MPDIEAMHPPADRLSAYAQGRLDEPEMDEIEQHLSSCDSCCQLIRGQPDDSLVAKLRGRNAATAAASVTEEMPAGEPPSSLQVPSSFVVGPADAAALHEQATIPGPPIDPPPLAGLPAVLNDHPRYRVVAALGAGGMGAVYRAEHRLMVRPVALKVIRGDLLGNAAMVERFRREVKAAARLASHPNIVAAYDAEQTGETHMLVMEFIEGTDLARVVDRRGPLPVGEACEYARQAALGLQHAFEDGMVHRDIKPQNLMRTNRGQIKILDFGLARFASEVATHAGLTAEGMVLGSADYIAPEQIDDPHTADIRADIYSLGCTLYFLLAGRPPFPDGSVIQKLLAHSEKTPRQLADVRPDVPPELARIVERMMAKSPSLRPSTPAEVILALDPIADAFENGRQTLDLPERNSATRGATKPDPGPTAVERLLSGSALDPGRHHAGATAIEKLSQIGVRAWCAAAALLFLGCVVAWAVVLRVKTTNGLIELVNLPRDAEVLVDGEEVAVTWAGVDKPAVVTVKPGKHKIMVKKDGIEISGDEVAVRAEGKERFTVRLVAQPKLPNEVPKVDGLQSMKNSIGMTLKRIPAGMFLMGSPEWEGDTDEHPQHEVRITRPFYLGVTEVTRGQFRLFLDETGYKTEAEKDGNGGYGWNEEGKKFEWNPRFTWQNPGFEQTDEHPVVNVSWNDAQEFTTWLSQKEGKTYRLPTEAEWEYACRAGTKTAHFSGDDAETLAAFGNIADGTAKAKYPELPTIAARDGYIYTAPVGRFRTNAFGLYDTHGNVWEWCQDVYDEEYYKRSPVDDPPGPLGSSLRVHRGGSWCDRPRYCRSADRGGNGPAHRASGVGFRLALGQSGG
jgi:formylglycine-generating enzyme required for sulfatase activity/serine/threonine protein kinase